MRTSHPPAEDADDEPASGVVLALADRHRRWLAPLLGVWFLLFCNGRWRPEPDGAVALTVGRSLSRGAGFFHPDGLDAPLSAGLPRVAAWGFRLFGDDSVLLPLAAVAVCWAAGLGLCFVLVRRAAGRPTAVVVTALLGLSEAWVSYGIAARTDLPFATGVLAVLLGWDLVAPPANRASRRGLGLGLCAAGLGMCFLSRSVWVVVAAALLLAGAVRLMRSGRWRSLLALGLAAPLGGGAALLVSPALRDDAAMLAHRFGRDAGGELEDALFDRLPLLFTESLPEAVFALDVGPLATAALSVALLAGLLLAASRPARPLWLILPALLAVQWMSLAVHDRYVLPLLPLLLLAWWTLAVRLEVVGFRTRVPVLSAALRWVVPAALVAAVGMNAAALVEVLHEQRSPEPLVVFADGKLQPVAEAAAWLRVHAPPDALVLASNRHATTLAFLADRRVLSGRELEKLRPAELPAGAWFFLEPLDERAHRAAEAAGLTAGEPAGPSLVHARRAES